MIMMRGGVPADFKSFFTSRCAARESLRRWIRTARTKPLVDSAPTATVSLPVMRTAPEKRGPSTTRSSHQSIFAVSCAAGYPTRANHVIVLDAPVQSHNSSFRDATGSESRFHVSSPDVDLAPASCGAVT